MTTKGKQRTSGTPQSKNHVNYGTLLLALLCIRLLSQTASAYVPLVVAGMASTFIEGQLMLIHGGTTTLGRERPIQQTFVLNLRTTWNTSQPDITHLYDAFADYNFASALSSDFKTWFMLSNSTIHKFDLASAGWSDFAPSQYLSNKSGLRAATDSVTGMVYVPNGFFANGSYSMLQYSPNAGTTSSIPMDPELVSLSDSAVVWSTARRSMLVHGGLRTDQGEIQQGLYEFVPGEDGGKWTLLLDKGVKPGPRRGHCLVPAYGGSKMILFGGFKQPWLGERVTSDIYSLEMATLTWTSLSDPGERYARTYHACAVSSDMFVSWGGADAFSNAISENNNVTLVYNLKKNVWQTTYSPVPEQAGSVPISLAAICGIAAGSVGVVLAMGYVEYRRRQYLSKTPSPPSAASVAKDHSVGGGNTGDGKRTGCLTPRAETQYGQHYWHQRQSSPLPHSEDGLVPAYLQQLHVESASSTGSELDGDESTYRLNEIMIRSPQAIIDTHGYQDCASTARSPQSLQSSPA
ncbi:unnamed protein product [Mortierella alpina]